MMGILQDCKPYEDRTLTTLQEQWVPGTQGTEFYTWIKFADDAEGNGMSDEPEGKAYIGISFLNTSPDDTNDPADYQWRKIFGEDGTVGISGEDGVNADDL